MQLHIVSLLRSAGLDWGAHKGEQNCSHAVKEALQAALDNDALSIDGLGVHRVARPGVARHSLIVQVQP